MADPGQIAYEARFTDEDRRKRYVNEWARLGPEERAVWARVELAAISTAGRMVDGDDRFSACIRTLNYEWAALKASTTERVENAQAEERRLGNALDWLAEQKLVLYPYGGGWRLAGGDGAVVGFGETPIAAIIYARSQVPNG